MNVHMVLVHDVNIHNMNVHEIAHEIVHVQITHVVIIHVVKTSTAWMSTLRKLRLQTVYDAGQHSVEMVNLVMTLILLTCVWGAYDLWSVHMNSHADRTEIKVATEL